MTHFEPHAHQPLYGWWAFDLPGYRPHPKKWSTYSLFAYEALPPLPHFEGGFLAWLAGQSPVGDSLATGGYPDGSGPDLSAMSERLREAGLPVPSEFLNFWNVPALHSRVPSCTACYLEPAERAVRLVGRHTGALVHFLSDQQSCLHWYLHLQEERHQVLVSMRGFGFNFGDEDDPGWSAAAEVDLEHEQVWVCAPSFADFILRFWLENDVWFALRDKRQLRDFEQAYLDWYHR